MQTLTVKYSGDFHKKAIFPADRETLFHVNPIDKAKTTINGGHYDEPRNERDSEEAYETLPP